MQWKKKNGKMATTTKTGKTKSKVSKRMQKRLGKGWREVSPKEDK